LSVNKKPKSLEFLVAARYDATHNPTLSNAFIAHWSDRIEENSINLFNDYQLMTFEDDAVVSTLTSSLQNSKFLPSKAHPNNYY
jgi:hypothetical protein